MGFTIGKRMTAFPFHAQMEQGAGPWIGSPNMDTRSPQSAGSFYSVSPMSPAGMSRGVTLTALTGLWRGLGSLNPAFLWFSGGASISPGGSAASFSLSVAGTYRVTCRVSCGNATWGTYFKDVVAPGLSVL